MKRVLLVLALIVTFTIGVSALDYATFADAFQNFADDVATTLPATAAVAGLGWSPAYIGQFPHFGVGVSLGASTIPYAKIEPLVDDLGITLPSKFDYFKNWGVPIPALALDARLGGFVLPFDVGFKIGFVPDKMREKLGKVNLDYLLVGGDVRVPLLKEKGWRPALSVSGGYTFMRGNVGVPDVIGTGDYEVDLTAYPTLGVLRATAPELAFTWDTHTFVGKIQASKNLFLFTPHIGLGAAYGVSNAGGGLSSSVEYDDLLGGGFQPIDQTEIDAIKNALAAAGQPVPDIDNESILISSGANGFSFWVYGGTAINIFILKVDLSAMYNLMSKSYGGAVNVRIQF